MAVESCVEKNEVLSTTYYASCYQNVSVEPLQIEATQRKLHAPKGS
ncbi:hypothetical protein MUK42_36552 [Musa troglodytarum]|uniref:Uncharacterized protein n=1 Tax=Musa troglodytarum TaxID=320322 RepID=A0A9E7FMK4_9LILI|nr:hypothetical protein MUK42_36552 [Musa troglodytarum]